MKKRILFIALVIALFSFNNSTYAARCCQRKSKDLKTKYDSKNFHYVECNCPCYEYILSPVGGICPQCGCYHDPDELEAERRVVKRKERQIKLQESKQNHT